MKNTGIHEYNNGTGVFKNHPRVIYVYRYPNRNRIEEENILATCGPTTVKVNKQQVEVVGQGNVDNLGGMISMI